MKGAVYLRIRKALNSQTESIERSSTAMSSKIKIGSKAKKAARRELLQTELSNKLFLCFLLALGVIYCCLSYKQPKDFAIHKRISQKQTLSGGQAPIPSRVQTWNPHSVTCKGKFLHRNSSHGVPPLMLREAAVDFRHNSLREFRENASSLYGDRPFRRIILQISAAPDGRIPSGMQPVKPKRESRTDHQSDEHPVAYITKADGSRLRDVLVNVDYILRDPKCAHICFYIDAARTICAGQEWQVILSVVLPENVRTDKQLQDEIEKLAIQDARIALILPVILPSGKKILFDPWLTFTCVSGLTRSTSPSQLMRYQSTKITTCEHTTGAIQVSGGPLFGYKRASPGGQKEIAHYAARALLGSVRFDTVAVGIIPNRTVSEIISICQENSTCSHLLHKENSDMMNQIALTIEKELHEIGVPRNLWPRIILFPFCRLGSDFSGYEAEGNACKWSAYYGQLILNNHAYTVFSPYHRWLASVDLDEFLVKETEYLLRYKAEKLERKVARAEPAAVVFDRRSKLTGVDAVPGALRFRWMDYRSYRQQWINMTNDVIKFGGLEMKSTDSAPLNRSACYGYKRIEGKSVVSCEFGIGVSNHDLLLLRDSNDLESRFCNGRSEKNFDEEIVTYHARSPTPRNGKCLYHYIQ